MAFWPLPDDFVEDPNCTPAALRAGYTRLLELLAFTDPARLDPETLANLERFCRVWGLPSPRTVQGRTWARQQLADMPPAGSPGEEAGR